MPGPFAGRNQQDGNRVKGESEGGEYEILNTHI
jgi:hypothetical protein